MFDDIKDVVNNYIELKEKLRVTELFLKETLKNKMKNSKESDIIDTIITLVGSQKKDSDVRLEKKLAELDVDEQINGRI